jgi:hypothetical protein
VKDIWGFHEVDLFVLNVFFIKDFDDCKFKVSISIIAILFFNTEVTEVAELHRDWVCWI